MSVPNHIASDGPKAEARFSQPIPTAPCCSDITVALRVHRRRPLMSDKSRDNGMKSCTSRQKLRNGSVQVPRRRQRQPRRLLKSTFLTWDMERAVKREEVQQRRWGSLKQQSGICECMVETPEPKQTVEQYEGLGEDVLEKRLWNREGSVIR